MIKKLTKGIEECKQEKERVIEQKDKLRGMFKEIEEKAFAVQENYKNTQKVPLILYLLSSSDFSFQNSYLFCTFLILLRLLTIFICSLYRQLMTIKMH